MEWGKMGKLLKLFIVEEMLRVAGNCIAIKYTQPAIDVGVSHVNLNTRLYDIPKFGSSVSWGSYWRTRSTYVNDKNINLQI